MVFPLQNIEFIYSHWHAGKLAFMEKEIKLPHNICQFLCYKCYSHSQLPACWCDCWPWIWEETESVLSHHIWARWGLILHTNCRVYVLEQFNWGEKPLPKCGWQHSMGWGLGANKKEKVCWALASISASWLQMPCEQLPQTPAAVASPPWRTVPLTCELNQPLFLEVVLAGCFMEVRRRIASPEGGLGVMRG